MTQILSLRFLQPKAARDHPLRTRAAFAHLYETSHMDVFRYTYGLTGGHQQDAEDITAETFLKAWDARHTFYGDEAGAVPWLLTIAKRLVIDRARRTQTTPTTIHIEPIMLAAPHSTPEHQVIQAEQAQQLCHLLQILPDDHREIVTLRYLLGWQIQDIAKHLGKKPNTVTVTLKRILERLQTQWHIEEIGKTR